MLWLASEPSAAPGPLQCVHVIVWIAPRRADVEAAEKAVFHLPWLCSEVLGRPEAIEKLQGKRRPEDILRLMLDVAFLTVSLQHKALVFKEGRSQEPVPAELGHSMHALANCVQACTFGLQEYWVQAGGTEALLKDRDLLSSMLQRLEMLDREQGQAHDPGHPQYANRQPDFYAQHWAQVDPATLITAVFVTGGGLENAAEVGGWKVWCAAAQSELSRRLGARRADGPSMKQAALPLASPCNAQLLC